MNTSIYLLTRIGRELCSLGKYEASNEYLKEFAKQLKQDKVKVEIGDLQPMPDNPKMVRLINAVNV